MGKIICLLMLIALVGCSINPPEVVRPGEQVDGAVSGKCYRLKSKDPFREGESIMKVLEVHPIGYMRYQYHLGFPIGFNHKEIGSDRTHWVEKIYEETICP